MNRKGFDYRVFDRCPWIGQSRDSTDNLLKGSYFMRSFMRDIWKGAPKNRRPTWKDFCDGIRSGEIKVFKKRESVNDQLTKT